MTSGGQKVAVLAQSVIQNATNTSQTLTKAVVKVQVTSVPASSTTTMVRFIYS